MDASISDFSWGLFIWQILALIVIISVFFLLLKIYKKVSKYLDLQIEYLQQRIDSDEEK